MGMSNYRRLIAGIAAVCASAFAQAAVVHAQDTGPRLDFPAGLATDGTFVYVANSRNNTIDKIAIAGHSLTQLAGKLFEGGSIDGPGTNARFASLSGLALGGADLFVADSNNSVIRKITQSGTVSTVAGSPNNPGQDDGHGPAAHFNLPTQMAADAPGTKLYIADTNNNSIRMLTLADNNVKTIGGQPQGEPGKEDGPATKSSFSNPRGIATDGKYVFVADTGNNLIRKIDLSNMTSSMVAGSGEEGEKNGTGVEAQFNNPGALATDGTTLFVMDADNHTIRKI